MNRFAPLFVIFAAALWGVDGIVLRPALYSLPVPVVVFVESGIVALFLTPLFAKQFGRLKLLTTKDFLAFGAVALFGGALGTMAITKALFYVNYINLSVVVLIQKLQPVFAIILAALLLKEKLPKIFFLWACVAVAGAYLMTFGLTLPNFNTGDKTTLAALFALIAAFSFGASTVLSKRALKNVSYGMGTYLRFLFTTILMFFILISFDDISNISEITSSQLMIFGIIAFTSGGLAIYLYYYGLKRISASVATICELAFPLSAILLEYFIRGNIMNWIQWCGAVILTVSIIRVTRLKVTY